MTKITKTPTRTRIRTTSRAITSRISRMVRVRMILRSRRVRTILTMATMARVTTMSSRVVLPNPRS